MQVIQMNFDFFAFHPPQYLAHLDPIPITGYPVFHSSGPVIRQDHLVHLRNNIDVLLKNNLLEKVAERLNPLLGFEGQRDLEELVRGIEILGRKAMHNMKCDWIQTILFAPARDSFAGPDVDCRPDLTRIFQHSHELLRIATSHRREKTGTNVDRLLLPDDRVGC